jgi:hypothetical protein
MIYSADFTTELLRYANKRLLTALCRLSKPLHAVVMTYAKSVVKETRSRLGMHGVSCQAICTRMPNDTLHGYVTEIKFDRVLGWERINRVRYVLDVPVSHITVERRIRENSLTRTEYFTYPAQGRINQCWTNATLPLSHQRVGCNGCDCAQTLCDACIEGYLTTAGPGATQGWFRISISPSVVISYRCTLANGQLASIDPGPSPDHLALIEAKLRSLA